MSSGHADESCRQLSIEQLTTWIPPDYVPERVTLHGFGEPLLHPQLPEIVRFFSLRSSKVMFTTNGTLLTPTLNELLVTSGLDQLHVSFDAATPHLYNLLRAPADFADVLRKIKSLLSIRAARQSVKPSIALMTTVCTLNYQELLALPALCAQLGVDPLIVNPFVPSTSEHAQYRWEPDDPGRWRALVAEQAHKVQIRLQWNLPTTSGFRHGGTESCCPRIASSVYVAVDGNLYPCCRFPHSPEYSLAKLERQTIGDLWNAPAMTSFRRNPGIRANIQEFCASCPEVTSSQTCHESA